MKIGIYSDSLYSMVVTNLDEKYEFSFNEDIRAMQDPKGYIEIQQAVRHIPDRPQWILNTLNQKLYDKLIVHTDFLFDITDQDIDKLLTTKEDLTRLCIIDYGGEFLDEYVRTFLTNLTKRGVTILSALSYSEYDNHSIKDDMIEITLLHYYHFLNDKINIFPSTPSFINKDVKYDFVYHFGLNYDFYRKKKRFDETIGNIDFKNKTIYTPNLLRDTKRIKYELGKKEKINYGLYNWYSNYEMSHAKIKLVAESSYDSFISEKTLKCFLSEQPYFIFTGKDIKQKLKDIGFDFPEPNELNKSIEYISKICEGNLDEWIEENKHYYINNQKNLLNLIYNHRSRFGQELLNFIGLDDKH